MKYNWKQIRQDAILGLSFGQRQGAGADKDLIAQIKHMVMASQQKRLSPIMNQHDLELCFTANLQRKLIGEEVIELFRTFNGDFDIYAFMYLVRYCRHNQYSLPNHLIIELFEYHPDYETWGKWMSLLLEDDQIKIWYIYEESLEEYLKQVEHTGLGFDSDWHIKTIQKSFWKALNDSDKTSAQAILDEAYQHPLAKKDIIKQYVHFLEDQLTNPSYIIEQINACMQYWSEFGDRKLEGSLKQFLLGIHIKTLIEVIGEDKMDQLLAFESFLNVIVENLYRHNDFQHASWLLRRLLQKGIIINSDFAYQHLLFGVSEEDYKSIWVDIVMGRIPEVHARMIYGMFIFSWQELPLSLVKQIVPLLNPSAFPPGLFYILDRLTYIVSSSDLQEAYHYFSNLNNPVIARSELDGRMQMEQYLVKRKGLLEVLNKYGQLPK